MAPPRPDKKGKGKAPATSSVQVDLPNAILEVIPDPIATLNLGDPEKIAESYEKCVTDIIEFIKRESGKGFTFVVEGNHEHKFDRYVPVTPGEDESPNGAYTIAITNGARTLRLVAQKYQTWFRGFVTDSGKRYEIDGMSPKMMVGSRSHYTFSRCLQCIKNVKDELVGENKINDWGTKCLAFYEENQGQETVVLNEESSEIIKEIAQEFSILCRSEWDRWLEDNDKQDGGGSKSKKTVGASGSGHSK